MRSTVQPVETSGRNSAGGDMDVLSTTDGSAQAVRDAVAASDADDTRLGLERELDRLNGALGTHAAAASQYLNWTLLAQAFLLTAYLIVLVGGWTVPLPGKRWLLAAIAGYGAVSLVLGYLSHRGCRDRLAPLRQSRRVVEQALERVARRPAVFSRERALAAALGEWSARLLPLAILAGWGALTLYTLALPLPTDGRAASAAARAESRGAAAASGAGATVTSAPRPRAAVRKAEEPAAAAPVEASAEPAAEGESGLAALFRRALNTPPAEQPAEAVKP
jgi:hypothetical protein